MRVLSFLIPIVLTCVTALPSQKGAFTVYGSGCGGGSNACLSANWGKALRNFTGLPANFAILFRTSGAPLVVVAVQLHCKTQSGSAARTTVGIWDRTSGGQPGKMLASGTMQVGGVSGDYAVTFSKPLILARNTDYFIVFDNRVGLTLPISTGTNQTYYFNGPPTWRGPFTSLAWNYRILCSGAGPTPMISNVGLPAINKSFSINLSNVSANAQTLWAVGVTKTSVDLTTAGAPGCALLTNPLAVVPLTADSMGNASVKIGVPNIRSLVGFQFMNQFAVLESTANPLGMIFSRGGAARVGT